MKNSFSFVNSPLATLLVEHIYAIACIKPPEEGISSPEMRDYLTKGTSNVLEVFPTGTRIVMEMIESDPFGHLGSILQGKSPALAYQVFALILMQSGAALREVDRFVLQMHICKGPESTLHVDLVSNTPTVVPKQEFSRLLFKAYGVEPGWAALIDFIDSLRDQELMVKQLVEMLESYNLDGGVPLRFSACEHLRRVNRMMETSRFKGESVPSTS